MIQNRNIISLAIFMSLGLLGLLFPAVGASLPGIENYYNVGLSSSGIVSSLVQLGYALFCFAGGILGDFFGKKKVLVSGALIYGLTGILLAYSQTWGLSLVLFFIFGMGSGLIFIASNTLVIDIYAERSGTFLNIHHTFFSMGSLLAPIVVRALLANGYPWYTIFRLLGLTALFLGAIILSSRISSSSTPQAKYTATHASRLTKYKKVMTEKRFIHLLVIVFLAIGVQFGIIYLLVSFLIKVRGMSFGDASLVMSFFYGLILIGRLLCSYIVSRVSPHKVVLFLLFFLLITLTAGWLTTGTFSMIMFALTGLASSGLMPTLISIAGSTLEPTIRSSALGLLSMSGGLGGMLTTLVITNLADYIGFNTSFTLMIIISILSIGLFIRIMAAEKKTA
ncbi:MAG: MFS transporter [Spirochaetales bacterium]|uniref:MFS transporter n=1 Tax=Candidatus Thalassospirochaeta sargassi TaxID=3119039 RepID=A0AAJ1IGB9_9SPIO|nr:MFS transporter [Spirochaetales bacterium]